MPSEQDAGRRPNLFIIGAPKSGTTSLYDYLAAHPAVYMSPVKEPAYFSRDVQAGLRRRFTYGTDESAYMALFSNARDEKWRGEASTRYLSSREAPDLVHEMEPDARIIVMLRNPVEFVHALHNERVSQGAEDVADFENALALDAERRAGRRLPPGSNPLGAVYRDVARFGEQLERWLQVFGAERVHVIIFDDFAKDTPGEYGRVLSFLAIDANHRPATFDARNKSHQIRGGIVSAAVASRPTQLVAHKVLPALVGRNRTARLGQRFRHSRIYRRPSPRQEMPAKIRDELSVEFAPDVALLSRLVGRDLNAEWIGPAPGSADVAGSLAGTQQP